MSSARLDKTSQPSSESYSQSSLNQMCQPEASHVTVRQCASHIRSHSDHIVRALLIHRMQDFISLLNLQGFFYRVFLPNNLVVPDCIYISQGFMDLAKIMGPRLALQ